MHPTEADFRDELAQIQSESIGWMLLEQGTYFHVSSLGRDDLIVITGLPDAGLDGENVLLLV